METPELPWDGTGKSDRVFGGPLVCKGGTPELGGAPAELPEITMEPGEVKLAEQLAGSGTGVVGQGSPFVSGVNS